MPSLAALTGSALMAALLAVPRPAAAADRVHECIAAHAEGQLLKNQGRLLAAKARFSECMVDSCPAIVREECLGFERSVSAALPSVVLAAIDESGQATSEPVVTVDDSSTLLRLDGRAVALDPGPHRLRFRRADGAIRDVELALAGTDRERRVIADFRPSPVKRDGERDGQVARTVILVSGGVAVLALGSFTYFALSGHAIESELQRCKPNCEDRDELGRMRTRYTLADISLGAALVSLGVGAFAFAKRPSAFARDGTWRRARVALGVRPSAGSRGLGLWASGEF